MVTYGDWARINGLLDEMDKEIIEEAKSLLYENARDSLEEVGVNISEQTLEWVIRQSYSNGEMMDDKPFEGSVPYVTIAWKTVVDDNGR